MMTSHNVASIIADKGNILDIKPGDMPKKTQLWRVALTGLGFLPYIGFRSQDLW